MPECILDPLRQKLSVPALQVPKHWLFIYAPCQPALHTLYSLLMLTRVHEKKNNRYLRVRWGVLSCNKTATSSMRLLYLFLSGLLLIILVIYVQLSLTVKVGVNVGWMWVGTPLAQGWPFTRSLDQGGEGDHWERGLHLHLPRRIRQGQGGCPSQLLKLWTPCFRVD